MNFKRYLLPLIPILGFFLCWQFLATSGLINAGLFSAPANILRDLANLFNQRIGGHSILLSHLLITLERLFMASLGEIIVGILVGVFMGISQRVYRFFDPIITLIMPIPGIAMAPLFIIWMGFGNPTIITVGAIATFFPVAYNTSTGVRSIDIQLVRAAAIMGARRSTTRVTRACSTI